MRSVKWGPKKRAWQKRRRADLGEKRRTENRLGMRRHRASNPEFRNRQHASTASWKRRNRQRVNALNRLSRERLNSDPEHRKRVTARELARQRRDIEKTRRIKREAQNRRRAKKASAAGGHSYEQWIQRVSLHGWRCHYCQRLLDPSTLTKDHRIPLSTGGSDFPANLVPACKSCNSRKRNRIHCRALR